MSAKNQAVVNCQNSANNKPLLDHKFHNITPIPKVPIRGSCQRGNGMNPDGAQATCIRVKNPWMLRIAGVFTLIVIIVVFAALHSKLNTSLRKTEVEYQRLQGLVAALKTKVSQLELSVRCADGDVSGACASKTRRKDNQGDKRRRPTTGTPTKNPNSPPKRRKSSRRKTVFVRWGKPHCNVYNRAQTTIIYTGRVASPHHTESGGGANYMCLPDKAFYTNPANISRVDRAFLYPVKYGPVQKAYQKYPDHILAIMSPEERKKHSEPLDNKDVPCAMCQIDGATSSIMIPAHNICPPMWKKQYHGYLLSQKHNAEKTEYICVDIEAEGVASSQDHPGASYLHLSEFKCTSGSCFGSYRTNEALTCVVCAT
ncbi:uncharacterized protein LOC116619038 isoform X2 [Nematostella vectensis]|uniref:uncharacterized protein LOC116619038 isoform X2 n=1 Tax=Nematostella vectensis TaxID=45351 RepID=UPI00207757F5|nr:uncharacterized protein LOC116619038 isoform X2 [Nematostella vectensis]